jgi:hypothetical protein
MSEIIEFPARDIRSREAKLWDELLSARDQLHDEITGPLPMLKVETMRRYVKAYDAFMAVSQGGGAA